MIAVSNDELGEAIKEGDLVENIDGSKGKVKCVGPLYIIEVGETAFLVGIRGKLMPGCKKEAA
jgi:hypothetical protein